MDLVEIRKKAQQGQDKSSEAGEALPQVAPETEQLEEFVLPQSDPAPRTTATDSAILQQYFPDLNLATEEDYIQGISGVDRSEVAETTQWLTFMLGEEEYALSLDVVLELIKPREFTDLPKVPEYVKGILSLRGEVVPVVDIRLRLQLGLCDADSSQRIIICEGAEQSVGILVDQITQVVRIETAAIEPPPLVLSDVEKEFVAGVGRYQGRMLILLNPEEILQV